MAASTIPSAAGTDTRRRLIRTLVHIGVVLAAGILPGGLTEAAPLPASELKAGPELSRRLRGGEVLTRRFDHGDGFRGSQIRFWVRATPDQAFEILRPAARLAEYMPNLHSVRVLDDQTDGAIVKLVSSLPFAPELTIRRAADPTTRTITWTQLRSPYRRLEGRWAMAGLEDGTLMEYSLGLDTTGNMIPSWIISGLQQQGTRDLADHVRRRIESRGTWHKGKESGTDKPEPRS